MLRKIPNANHVLPETKKVAVNRVHGKKAKDAKEKFLVKSAARSVAKSQRNVPRKNHPKEKDVLPEKSDTVVNLLVPGKKAKGARADASDPKRERVAKRRRERVAKRRRNRLQEDAAQANARPKPAKKIAKHHVGGEVVIFVGLEKRRVQRHP